MKRDRIKEFLKSLPEEARIAFTELRCGLDRQEWRTAVGLPFRVETITPLLSSLLSMIRMDASEEDELGGSEEELRSDYESQVRYMEAELQSSRDLHADPEARLRTLATLREVLQGDEVRIAEAMDMSDRALQDSEQEFGAFTFDVFCEQQDERRLYLRERTKRHHVALRQIEAALAARNIKIALDHPLTFWESLEAAGVAADNGDGTVTFFGEDATEC